MDGSPQGSGDGGTPPTGLKDKREVGVVSLSDVLFVEVPECEPPWMGEVRSAMQTHPTGYLWLPRHALALVPSDVDLAALPPDLSEAYFLGSLRAM